MVLEGDKLTKCQLAPQQLTSHPTSGILPQSGWVRRGGALRTPSGPRGSSGKEVSPGAAGLPARIFDLRRVCELRLQTLMFA
jgi:hypothetical protein